MRPPDDLRAEYEEIMRMGRRTGGPNLAPSILARLGEIERVHLRLHREYRIDELTANAMSSFLRRPTYYEDLLNNVNRDLTINRVPDDQQRQIYDHILRIVREAKMHPILASRDAVLNQLKVQRLMSGKHADIESLLGPYFTESREPLAVQKSRALTLIGRPGVPDFTPTVPPPPPPPPPAPAATNVRCRGPQCSIAGGRRRRTTRSPSRSSHRRRSARSRRNRGSARSL